jgi:hypothetical protein
MMLAGRILSSPLFLQLYFEAAMMITIVGLHLTANFCAPPVASRTAIGTLIRTPPTA